MSQDELRFWSLIDQLGGSADDAAVARLRDALTGSTPDEIEAFDRQLQAHLASLEQPRYAGPITQLPGIAGSDDAALFARCAIVAAGRETYTAILEHPELVDRPWDIFGADLLCAVAADAYGAVTGDVLGGGTNDRVPPPHLPWVQLIFGGDTQLRPRFLWEAFFHTQERRLATDSNWLRWRQEQDIKVVWLLPAYRKGARAHGTERLRVGVRDGVVELHGIRDTSHLPPLPTPGALNREGDLLMTTVAERLKGRR